MSTDSAARVLTIIGLIFNGLNFLLSIAAALLLVPLLTWLGLDPMLGYLILPLLGVVVAEVFVALIVGLVVPIVGYRKIQPESKGTAAAILIVGGVIGVILTSIIGGILILVAGILVAAWHPFGAEGYRPIATKSLGPPPPFAAQPGIAPAAKLEASKDVRYCVACGTQLQGDEHYCPVCGSTVG